MTQMNKLINFIYIKQVGYSNNLNSFNSTIQTKKICVSQTEIGDNRTATISCKVRHTGLAFASEGKKNVYFSVHSSLKILFSLSTFLLWGFEKDNVHFIDSMACLALMVAYEMPDESIKTDP